MCLHIKYTNSSPSPPSSEPLCLQSLAGSAWMQQLDTQSTARGLAGPANAGKCWEPAHFIVLRLVGTCPIKHKKTLFSFHLKFTPVQKILSCISLSLFSFAFAPLLIPINCLEPYLQTLVSSTQTSLSSFRADINAQSLLQKAHTPTFPQKPIIFVDYRVVTNKQLQSF